MPDLSPAILELFAQQGTLLVPSRQRAASVRLAYAKWQLAQGHRSWQTPEVLTCAAWLQRQLQEARASGQPLPRVLGAAQEWVLWQHAATAIASEQAPLLSSDALARSLQSAAGLVAEHLISRAALQGIAHFDTEARWLLHGMASVEQAAGLLGAVPTHLALQLWQPVAAERPLRTIGLGELPAGWRQVLAAAGAEPLRMSVVSASSSVVEATDNEVELRLAAQWCLDRLAAHPTRRLLVVIPDLERRRGAVTRIFRDALCPDAPLHGDVQHDCFAFEGGAPLLDYPWIAQALTTLELLVRPLPRERGLQWLRSPFWQQSLFELAPLDLQLRRQWLGEADAATLLDWLGPVQLPAASALVPGLRQALALTGGPRQLPHEWAVAFQTALTALGSVATLGDSSLGAQLRNRWRELLEEFSDTAQVAGVQSAREALSLLAQLARLARFAPAGGDAAVTLTDSSEHPVAHYAGIWVCGRSAASWPEPAQPDAFVPQALQRQAGVQQSHANGQLQRAGEQLLAWQQCADELRLSWAANADDMPADASALLGGIPRATAATGIADSLLTQRARQPTTEPFADDGGPAWPAARELPGGSRSLELQDACAFRSFAELRLRARDIEQLEPGTNRMERGRNLHRALQLFWQQTRDHAGLVALTADGLRQRISQCVAEAYAEQGTSTDATDTTAAREQRRESQRAQRLLHRLAEFERQRLPFSVEASELSMTARIGTARIRLRMDRIDQLGSASQLALIDYKTSLPASKSEWLADRPRPVQLLTYLTAMGERQDQIDALATLHISRKAPAFKGVSAESKLLPGINLTPGYYWWKGKNAAADWPSQLALWRQRTISLADDFLAGRALPDPLDAATCEHCALTPLCRRVERVRYAADADSADDASAGDSAADGDAA